MTLFLPPCRNLTKILLLVDWNLRVVTHQGRVSVSFVLVDPFELVLRRLR